MREKYFRTPFAQITVVLICITTNGNVFGRRLSRSSELQGVAESANLFAEDVYSVLTRTNGSFEDRNLLISPLSLDIGLAMLRAGASGTTEQEITKGLRIRNGMKDDDVHNGFKDLITSFKDDSNEPDPDVQINIANRIYVGQIYPIKSTFLQTVRHHFFADAEQLNFNDANKAADTVNGWVQNATENRIMNIVTPSMLSSRTAMILVSAIHFKGLWKFPFNPENTTKKPFTTLAGNEIQMDMMRLDRPKSFKYAKLPELKSSALALPYSTNSDDNLTRYSMIILLPDKGENIKDIEASLKEGTLSKIPSRLRLRSVDVRMPKMILESNVDLIANKVIQTLDMKSMLTNAAEFGRLSNEPELHITSVVHKSFIEINEAGSEAAAASAIVATARSLDLEPGHSVKFEVDRPFIAYIYDSKTKTILFIARKIM